MFCFLFLNNTISSEIQNIHLHTDTYVSFFKMFFDNTISSEIQKINLHTDTHAFVF
jgi:hypothetical protein